MGRAAVLAATAGGIAAALGHAPFHLWWLAIPGFVAVIWSVSRARTRKASLFRAWLAGAAYFAVALHWIVEPFLVDAATHGWMAPGALILLAGGLALFWGLAGWLAALLGGNPVPRALAFALALSAAEVLRGHIFTGFPWAMPAYIWADTPVRAAAAYVGAYGLTCATLLATALLASGSVWRPGPVLSVFAFAALFAAGQARLGSAADETRLGRVGIVHPNVPQTEKWVRDKVPGHIDRLLELTRESAALPEPVDLVVWPEVAVVYPLDAAGGVLKAASDAANGVSVMTGINRREDGAWFNALVQVDSGGTVSSVYDKVHLVPFGEYIPFRLGILRAMAATTSNGFTAGDGVRLLDTPLGKALPLICYEGIFPGHAFKADARADYILLVTNDAWFGTFAGPFQHLDQARFRAIEHGLPVVRVANAGVSAVIDRFGNVTASLGLGEAGLGAGEVRTGPPTVYAQMGDAPLMAFLLVCGTVLWMTRRRNGVALTRA